jgi:hypothetical protein
MRTLVIQGVSYRIEKELGKGSFGVVYSGYDPEDKRVAMKDITCRSQKDLDQAVFEFVVMRKIQQNEDFTSHSPRRRRAGSAHEPVAALHCPKFLGMETIQERGVHKVLGVMEKVEGDPVDAFEAKWSKKMSMENACGIAKAMIEQLTPTFDRVADIAVHRDVNAHNILVNMPDGPESARFTLIDFGLAVDAREWQRGKWKTHDIGGDCRYWPTSAWMQFIYGYKYLDGQDGNGNFKNHYVYMLDVHSLALTALQFIIEVADPATTTPSTKALEPAWKTYWDAATNFWKQVYAVFSKGGDWNKMKRDFMQKQVQETTEKNVKRLVKVLLEMAKESGNGKNVQLFETIARMLETEVVTWREIMKSLEPREEELPPPVRIGRGGHRRNVQSTDGSGWMTRNVPQLGVMKPLPDGLENTIELARRVEVDLGSSRAPAPPLSPNALDPPVTRVRSHSRIRSADFAAVNVEYRTPGYLEAEEGRVALRKISEMDEGYEVSPSMRKV